MRSDGRVAMVRVVRTRGDTNNMAKAALEALALTLYKEERRHNVHANIVAPGLIETEMGATDLRALDARMPFGHVCQPDDVADVVRYLVSESADYLTGQRLQVDGGGGMAGPARQQQ